MFHPPLLTTLLAAVASVAQPVTLTRIRPVRSEVDSFPRIAWPTNDAQRRINRALDRLDQRAGDAVSECRKDSSNGGSWTRKIEATISGNEFISYVVTDDTYCGGAHPNTGHSAIVYDLRSGFPVDWTALLPSSLTGKLDLAEGEDGVRVVTLASPRLFTLYQAGYSQGLADVDGAKCREAVAAEGAEGPVPMIAWLDGRKQGLAVQFDFVHAAEACSQAVVIPLAALQREGARLRLLAALAAGQPARPKRVSFDTASAGEETVGDTSTMRTCYFRVDGVVRVNGRCLVYPMGEGEYTLNTWDRGKPARPHFAVVTRNEDGVAEATWNANSAESHALDSLGIVTMQNGCWVNRRARICAR